MSIELSWYLKEKNEIGKPISLIVCVTLKEKQDLNGWYIETEETEYFRSCREYFGQTNTIVNLELSVYSTANINTLPDCLSVQLKDKRDTQRAKMNIAWGMDQFTKSLPLEGTKKNILLFGMAGSSKSTFINSCYTLLGDNIRTQIAKSGGHSERITTDLQGYRLANIDKKFPTQIFLWDVWGLEQENYKNCEFECIISGKLTRGWKMTDEVPLDALIKPKSPELMQHCVIFFVPAGELTNHQSAMLLKTREFYRIATDLGVGSILVLSKIDTLVPEFRNNPSKTNTKVETMIDVASNFFGLQRNLIFPLINYHTENRKDFKIDKVIYKILSVATRIATNYHFKKC